MIWTGNEFAAGTLGKRSRAFEKLPGRRIRDEFTTGGANVRLKLWCIFGRALLGLGLSKLDL